MLQFQQLNDANGRAYIRVSNSGGRIHLACGKFSIQRVSPPVGLATFSVFHQDLFREIRFTRDDITGGDAYTDAGYQDYLTDSFNCCVCEGSAPAPCPDCCDLPAGISSATFDFLPGNYLDNLSVLIGGISFYIGDCGGDTPCGVGFDDQEIFSTSRLDFANGLAALALTWIPGALPFVIELPNDIVRLVILFPYTEECCNLQAYLGATSPEVFGCNSGPFDPEFFRTSLPSQTCCSGPEPCELDITPGNSVFTFTFDIATGPRTAGVISLNTIEGDCFALIFGNSPVTSVYSSTSMATLYYDFAFAKVGTGGIVAVTQPDAQSVRIEISGTACCGMTFSMNSTNPSWNLELANGTSVIKSEILCCP